MNHTLLKTIRGANKKVKKTERDTHVLAYNGQYTCINTTQKKDVKKYGIKL